MKIERADPLGGRSGSDINTARQRVRERRTSVSASAIRQGPTDSDPQTIRRLPLSAKQQARLEDEPDRGTLKDRTQPRQHAGDNAPAHGWTFWKREPDREASPAGG